MIAARILRSDLYETVTKSNTDNLGMFQFCWALYYRYETACIFGLHIELCVCKVDEQEVTEKPNVNANFH